VTPFETELEKADLFLRSVDERLAAVMAVVGPCTLTRTAHFRPFEALLSSIAHQQLSGKAAATILGRIRDNVGGGKWPTPEAVVAARTLKLRKCGLSGAKVLAVKDLARKTLDGTVPSARLLHRMEDEEIIDRLTQVRGVGRWTVEMSLMFRLGRLDVLPLDDFGVRKGFSRLYTKRELVTPKALAAHGERWRPYRTVASWYMWRVLELS
jgi:DNA-3-methyladenine glycosylase II